MSVAIQAITQELELVSKKIDEIIKQKKELVEQKMNEFVGQNTQLFAENISQLDKQDSEAFRQKMNELIAQNHELFNQKANGLAMQKDDHFDQILNELYKKKMDLSMQKIRQEQNELIEATSKKLGPTIAVFCNAARKGKINKVMRILKAGFDVNTNVKNGSSSVHYACDAGQMNIVFLFLEYGGDLSKVNAFGKTPKDYLSKENLALLNQHLELKRKNEKELFKNQGDRQYNVHENNHARDLQAQQIYDGMAGFSSASSKDINSVDIEQLKKFAEAGAFDAQVSLGYYYKTGSHNLTVDLKKAMEWFAKAAVQNPDKMGGMNNLINCLDDGLSLPEEARNTLQPMIDTLTKKANSNDVQSQITLGYYHMKGICLPKKQATYWFSKVLVENGSDFMGGFNNLITSLQEGIELTDEARKILQPKLHELVPELIGRGYESLAMILLNEKNDAGTKSPIKHSKEELDLIGSKKQAEILFSKQHSDEIAGLAKVASSTPTGASAAGSGVASNTTMLIDQNCQTKKPTINT